LTVSFKVIEFPIDEDAQTLLFRDWTWIFQTRGIRVNCPKSAKSLSRGGGCQGRTRSNTVSLFRKIRGLFSISVVLNHVKNSVTLQLHKFRFFSQNYFKRHSFALWETNRDYIPNYRVNFIQNGLGKVVDSPRRNRSIRGRSTDSIVLEGLLQPPTVEICRETFEADPTQVRNLYSILARFHAMSFDRIIHLKNCAYRPTLPDGF
jgi:hypothetical protein